MVLVETSKGHNSAIIYLDCLHVQILERLLVHFGTILVQVCEQIGVEEALVAGLVSVTGSNNVNLNTSILYGRDELVFKFVNVLNIRLDDANAFLGRFDHVEYLP